MGRGMKIAGSIVLGIVVVLVIAISATIGWRPFLGPRARAVTNRTFQRTPERLARGKYLAESVTGCMGCHSPHDWTKHDAPVTPGMEGAGEIFPIEGLPGRFVAPNLTPDPETGTGNWSEDTLARAIREGVGHDGRALFPLMPYRHFRQIPDEDMASIIVFLRSLPPVHNPLPKTDIIFPVKYLIRSVPEPLAAPVAQPDLSTPVKRGEYLVTIASCTDCHTPARQGQPLAGLEYAGGGVLRGPWGSVASANITPDPSRHLLLRRSAIPPGHAHRLREGTRASPDHAVVRTPRHDR